MADYLGPFSCAIEEIDWDRYDESFADSVPDGKSKRSAWEAEAALLGIRSWYMNLPELRMSVKARRKFHPRNHSERVGSGK